METVFKGLFDSSNSTVIDVPVFLLCIGISLALGLMIAFCARYRSGYSRNFFIALTVLPAIVCILIMMVNGNIGAGVAIAGAFALVRFRSSQGDAKQITLVFLTMASGLVVGMGYWAYAAFFTVIICLVLLVMTYLAQRSPRITERIINITIPEDLDYNGVFDAILAKYTKQYELLHVRTSNMGSLYRLKYRAEIKDPAKEKALIDDLRCRNGNLEISIMAHENEGAVL